MVVQEYRKGWDGASYQGIPRVKLMLIAGYLFCFEKITGEVNYVNLIWSVIRDLCEAAGVVFGGYDWVEFHLMDGPASGRFYARDYLRVYQPRPGNIICVDLESPIWYTGPLGRDIEATAKAYFFTLRDEGGARAILVYTARYFILEIGADKWEWFNEANGFYLWQAAPGPTATLPDDAPWPGTPAPFVQTIVHQYDWHKTAPGIDGEFDANRIRIGVEELVALLAVPGDDTSTGGEVVPQPTADMVPVPAEGKFGTIVLPNGNSVLILNFGGQTAADGIRNVSLVDVGIDVVSNHDPNVMEHRSFQNQEARPWLEYERPNPTAKLVAMGLEELPHEDQG